MAVSITSIVIGLFGLLSALKQCSGTRMRLTYNTCILGSWILYIMLGTVLVIIALKTPGELKKYSEDGKVDSLSPEYKFLAGPVSELDS